MKPFLFNDWQEVLAGEFECEYYQDLRRFLVSQYGSGRVYPPMGEIYTALHLTSFADTRVVILGQDPYHGEGQAQGLCFSVKPGVRLPPSLVNIFKELADDVGCAVPASGDLRGWAAQGVLLLNTTLTVREGRPKSHAGRGWERLTDAMISALNEREAPVVFLLWGAHAQSKMKLITRPDHVILTAPHPSPLSAHRGFFGSRPFSRANEALVGLGYEGIEWCRL